MSSNPKKHRFKKDKDGLEIEVTDPIQDIMSEEELTEAEKRIQELIEKKAEKNKKS
jgi:hypothetical protein